MAILADRQYTLAAFADIIREKSSEFDLPGATVNVINNLAQLVGAPSYQKTPVFKKREPRIFGFLPTTFYIVY